MSNVDWNYECSIAIIDFNQLDPVDGLHFGRPWCQRRRSGWVCSVFWTYLELQGAVPQGFNPARAG